jgi:hypothetical protein
MYIAPRLDDYPPFSAKVRTAFKPKRPAQMFPIPRLESLEEFGSQLRRQIVLCVSTGERSVVMIVAADTQATGPHRAELLSTFGSRLRSRVRTTDLVVRIGDDFGVFLQGDAAPHALMIRERLRLTLQGGYGFDDTSVQARPRFGVASHPGTVISGVQLVMGAVAGMES